MQQKKHGKLGAYTENLKKTLKLKQFKNPKIQNRQLSYRMYN